MILLHVGALVDRHRKCAAAQKVICTGVTAIQLDLAQLLCVPTGIGADISVRRTIRHQQADRTFVRAVALHDQPAVKFQGLRNKCADHHGFTQEARDCIWIAVLSIGAQGFIQRSPQLYGTTAYRLSVQLKDCDLIGCRRVECGSGIVHPRHVGQVRRPRKWRVCPRTKSEGSMCQPKGLLCSLFRHQVTDFREQDFVSWWSGWRFFFSLLSFVHAFDNHEQNPCKDSKCDDGVDE